MPAAYYDIPDMEAGAGYSFLLSQSGLDVTGYTAKLQVRATKNGAALVTLSTGAGITIAVTPAGADPVSSALDAEFTHTHTALIPGKAYYDILLTPPTGEPWRWIEGAVFCDPSVTR